MPYSDDSGSVARNAHFARWSRRDLEDHAAELSDRLATLETEASERLYASLDAENRAAVEQQARLAGMERYREQLQSLARAEDRSIGAVGALARADEALRGSVAVIRWLRARSAAGGPPSGSESLSSDTQAESIARSGLFDPAWYAGQFRDGSVTPDSAWEHFLAVGLQAHISPHCLFDAAWYAGRYPEATQEAGSALEHYLATGYREGCQPHPLFDAAWYLDMYPDVRDAGLDPLRHYLVYGTEDGRDPSPFFSTNWYLATYPDVRASGQNPLVHFVELGSAEGRNPSGLFDTGWYNATHHDVRNIGMSPLRHFVEYGMKEYRDPGPLFDTAWYVGRYGAPLRPGAPPFLDYLERGWREDRSPNPLFDAGWYRAAYPDTVGNPFVDFVDVGVLAGRNPNRFFDTAWYLRTNPDVAAAGTNPLSHYLSTGAREGRNPSLFFDTAWYVEQNPDVATSGVNPLAHFLAQGLAENRDPHPFIDSAFYFSRYPDARDSGQSIIDHYAAVGGWRNYNTHPLLDAEWYCARYGDIEASGYTPLEHYLIWGVSEDRDPGPEFSVKDYIAANGLGIGGRTGAFYHYVRFGRAQGLPRAVAATSRWRPRPLGPGQKRVLFVDSAYPTPDRDAGSLFAVNIITILQDLGFEVHFAASAYFARDPSSPIRRQAIDGLRRAGVQIIDDTLAPSIEDFVSANGDAYDLFFLCRIYCGGILYEQVRRHAPRARIVFNTVDLHYLRESREAALTGNLSALVNAYETESRELYLARQCDATIVVSDDEAELLRREAPGSRIFNIPLIQDVPGGRTPFRERRGIAFVGGFLHTPNLDAVDYFLSAIWPLIREAKPDIPLYIIGADMPDGMRDRVEEGVVFLGFRPDITAEFERIRVTVAPLRFGAGAKGKIVSSLSHGVPCVATPIAAEGMGLEDGSAVKVASHPAEFAAAVIALYSDEDVWTSYAERGQALMEARYSLNAGNRNIATMLERIGCIPGRSH